MADINMPTTLRECPFCGGEAERLDFETVGTALGDDPNAGGSCITCKRCGASSPVHFDRKENLYSSWNKRWNAAPEPPKDGEVERLRLGLRAAIRGLELAMFTIRKQNAMPNSSWESGFNSDLKAAKAALNEGRADG